MNASIATSVESNERLNNNSNNSKNNSHRHKNNSQLYSHQQQSSTYHYPQRMNQTPHQRLSPYSSMPPSHQRPIPPFRQMQMQMHPNAVPGKFNDATNANAGVAASVGTPSNHVSVAQSAFHSTSMVAGGRAATHPVQMSNHHIMSNHHQRQQHHHHHRPPFGRQGMHPSMMQDEYAMQQQHHQHQHHPRNNFGFTGGERNLMGGNYPTPTRGMMNRSPYRPPKAPPTTAAATATASYYPNNNNNPVAAKHFDMMMMNHHSLHHHHHQQRQQMMMNNMIPSTGPNSRNGMVPVQQLSTQTTMVRNHDGHRPSVTPLPQQSQSTDEEEQEESQHHQHQEKQLYEDEQEESPQANVRNVDAQTTDSSSVVQGYHQHNHLQQHHLHDQQYGNHRTIQRRPFVQIPIQEHNPNMNDNNNDNDHTTTNQISPSSVATQETHYMHRNSPLPTMNDHHSQQQEHQIHQPRSSGIMAPNYTSLTIQSSEKELDAASILCSLSRIVPNMSESRPTSPSLSSRSSSSRYNSDSNTSMSDTPSESTTIPSAVQPKGSESPSYPTRLAIPGDELELNSLHCFIRKHLLEIFVVKDHEGSSIVPTVSKDDDDNDNNEESCSVSKNTFGGRAGLRCAFCSGQVLRTSNASMRLFYPRKLPDLYKMISTWQRVHFAKCKYIPDHVRDTYQEFKTNDKTRGKKAYWITSARQIGLVDDDHYGGGLRFVKT